VRSAVARWTLPRHLHPVAWWMWALGLATAASRTTNPLLLLLVIAVAGYVVASRRTDAPWARAYAFYLTLGLVVILIRVVVAALFGAPLPGTPLVTLPELTLPQWAAGVRVGGAVTLEAVASAAYDGLRLATLLACVGAANALANPKRLLRCLPGALYEVGVAVVVAMSFTPQLVTSVRRIRAARRLRGRRHRGVRGFLGVAMPVLEDALERSLALAAAMDSRGYGRQADVPAGTRRTTAALTLGGLLGVCAGVYGLLDAGSPALLGLPLLALGLAVAMAGIVVGGRRAVRSRYRPDPWSGPEWAVTAAGVTAATSLVLAGALGGAGLHPTTYPLVAPGLPLLPTLGVLAAILPAWLAPVPPGGHTRRRSPPATGMGAKDVPLADTPAHPREPRRTGVGV
jgi:energy-coupling factor transport system permease protein